MRNTYFFILSMIIIFSQCNCTKDNPNGYCQRDLEFELYAQTQGLQDTISINDTIWFHLEIDSIATDLISGEEFDIFKDNDYSSWVLSIDDLDTYNLSAANDFNFYSKIGLAEAQNFTAGVLTGLNFADYPSKKIIDFGIVPQKSGSYFMGYTYINSVDRNGMRVIIPNCSTKVDVYSTTNAEDSSQNNYYLLEASPLQEYRDYSEEAFNGNGSFAFHVKE